jgi:aminoglycoside phosphotransferase family enzyme/predicted kinase
VADPAVIETHISKLVFTDDHVYKVKRPVRFGFVDLSTPAARLRSCQAEVALNSRLSPDVYEGVGVFRHPDGHDEPVVVMRRLPDDRRLSHLVKRGDPAVGVHLQEIAAKMARFHAGLESRTEVDRDCSPDAVAALWQANLEELRSVAHSRIPKDHLDEISFLATHYLAGRSPLLQARVSAGRAVDGHGDLLADDIFCMHDGPRILDCLEFDSHLRHCDALSDVASLAMDIERLGRPDLARRFLSTYRHHAGDSWPESLQDMYIAYRATVRAKVACLRAEASCRCDDDNPAESTIGEARKLALIALRHLRDCQVRLVLIGGLPGTGKSTLGKRIEAATGWTLIRSDVVRKQLAGIDPSEDASTSFGSGIYSQQATALVYAAMLARAEGYLDFGRSVILDASWLRRCWRDEAADLAARCQAALVGLRCETPREVASARLIRRALTHTDPSDATVGIADAMAEAVEPWLEAEVINTSQQLQESVEEAFELLGVTYQPELDTW